ncbi:MAG: hypothetical protein IPL06_10840 [Betaproteobacteria bacterium]|nr:hypothetical protein [Betaproteobacteria bacterium]
MAAQRDDTKYALGSVLNHVLLHQTVIGIEAQAQLELANDYPDVIVGCTGGGSNFAGIMFPFWVPSCAAEGRFGWLRWNPRRARASHAASTPTISGTPRISRRSRRCTRWDRPSRLRASMRAACGITAWRRSFRTCRNWPLTSTAYHQTACFEAGVLFARAEGIVPAPEANHAVRGRSTGPSSAVRRAFRARSCSTCAGTGTSTCRPTSTTSAEAEGPGLRPGGACHGTCRAAFRAGTGLGGPWPHSGRPKARRPITRAANEKGPPETAGLS